MNSSKSVSLSRRRFLQRAGAAAALPMVVPASVFGLNGTVAPSNRVVFGALGVGNRARAILPNFLSFSQIQFAGVSDCREDRLNSAKELVDRHYGNEDCKAHPDFRDLLG